MATKVGTALRCVSHRLRYLGWLFGIISLMFLWEGEAHAQYKHAGFGGTIGLQNTFNQAGNGGNENTRDALGYGVGLSYISLGFEANYRFENKLGVAFESYVSFHSCGGPSPQGLSFCDSVNNKTPIMFTALVSLRYYFITDEFRPFIDAGLGYWRSVAYTKNALNAFGPAINVGFEWFFKEEVSIGLQIRYSLQLLAESSGISPFHQIMGGAVFRAYL